MTGPNPFLAGGKIVIRYTTDEPLTHEAQIPVSPIQVGSAWFVETQGLTNYPWHTAVDEWVAVVKPNFSAASTFVGATLYKYVAGVFQAVDTYTFSVIGTGGSGIPGNEVIITFRDDDYHMARVYLMGTQWAVPYKVPPESGLTAIDSVVTSYRTRTVTNVGWWALTKADVGYATRLKYTIGLNKKSLRRLNRA